MKLQLVGKVVSVAMQKTVRVVVTRIFMHPKYEKLVRKDKGYLVHNENPDVALGDMVRIEECRPMSKHKRTWYSFVVGLLTVYTRTCRLYPARHCQGGTQVRQSQDWRRLHHRALEKTLLAVHRSPSSRVTEKSYYKSSSLQTYTS